MGSLHAVSSLYFTRSGAIHLDTTSLRVLGVNGIFWSASTSNFADSAYDFFFIADYLYSSTYSGRVYGFSLRCLSSLPRPSGRGRKILKYSQKKHLKTALSFAIKENIFEPQKPCLNKKHHLVTN